MLSKGIFCLRRAKSFVNAKALRNLYFSLFHSHLLYCNLILSCLSNKNLNRITKLQKKAIRIVTNSTYNAHTANLFQSFKILPFEKIIYFNKLIFMHSVKYGYVHTSFQNTWQLNENRDINYELRNTNDFAIPPPRFEGFRKYPLYSFPSAWNGIGEKALYKNRVTFKFAIRDWLFDQLVPLN